MTTAPDALLTGPFRGGQALELGLTREQLGSRRFVRLFRDVYAPAEIAADPGVRHRGALLLAPHAGLSHTSAATDWELPLPVAMLRDPVHLGVPWGTAQPRVRGIVVHELRLEPGDIVEHEGVRVTSPARTVTDLAAWLSLADLVALLDAGLRRGLLTRASLAHEVDADRAHRGVRRLRRAVGLADPRAESPRESHLRVVLACAGLPAPEVNEDIHDEQGRWLARGDLPYFPWQTLVEYDGAGHNEDPQRQRDLRRRIDLTRAGWRVLAYGAEAMRLPDAITAEVWDVLRERGWPAPGPRPLRLDRDVLRPPRRPR